MNGLLIKSDGTVEDWGFDIADKNFEDIQRAVGGYVETHASKALMFSMNDEAAMRNQPPNELATNLYLYDGGKALLGLPFRGDIIVTGRAQFKTDEDQMTRIREILRLQGHH